MQTKYPAGTRVRLTTKFLRSTGQVSGSDANGKWLVQDCSCGLCARGGFVATNQRNVDDDGQRHIAIGNVQAVR